MRKIWPKKRHTGTAASMWSPLLAALLAIVVAAGVLAWKLRPRSAAAPALAPIPVNTALPSGAVPVLIGSPYGQAVPSSRR